MWNWRQLASVMAAERKMCVCLPQAAGLRLLSLTANNIMEVNIKLVQRWWKCKRSWKQIMASRKTSCTLFLLVPVPSRANYIFGDQLFPASVSRPLSHFVFPLPCPTLPFPPIPFFFLLSFRVCLHAHTCVSVEKCIEFFSVAGSPHFDIPWSFVFPLKFNTPAHLVYIFVVGRWGIMMCFFLVLFFGFVLLFTGIIFRYLVHLFVFIRLR